MNKEQLQELRELPIESVAERLGLSVAHHKSLCPFHADSHPSLSFHKATNTYRCFVCGAHGGTIDLAMKVLNLAFPDACHWLADQHNVILEAWQPAPKTAANAFDPQRYERYFQRPWISPQAWQFLYAERRISPTVVRWCRLTSWTDRHGTPWLQIPYFDTEGKLTGLQNRNLLPDARPRFRFPQGTVCGIYNLPVVKLLKPGDELWIAEGCSDCWALLSTGRKAIAIPSTTLLKPTDIEMLKQLTQGPSTQGPLSGAEAPLSPDTINPSPITIHMFPDQDEPGERLFRQLKAALPTLVHHQLPPDYKDYSEYHLSRYHSTP